MGLHHPKPAGPRCGAPNLVARARGCHNQSILKEFLVLAGSFLGTTLLALLFGAKNLGTALTFGEIAFAAALVAVILLGRRPEQRQGPPE